MVPPARLVVEPMPKNQDSEDPLKLVGFSCREVRPKLEGLVLSERTRQSLG
jgi:hypothetical protein